MAKNRGWRRMLVVGAAFLLVGALVALPTMPAHATKKPDPKKKVEPKETKSFITEIHVGPSGSEQIEFINTVLEKQWKANTITPADRCSDYEFIRRASLDIVGRIAKVHEIDRYMSWPAAKRRSMLIETLMGFKDSELKTSYSQEFANNWANHWTTLLLTRRGVGKMYMEQMHSWLEDKFTEKVNPDNNKVEYSPDWAKIVTEILTATGKTNDNGAVNYVLAHLGETVKDKSAGNFDFVPVTSRTTKLFLGLRTQCVQCHDHPFNGDWEQKHFWGVNAFFRQTTASGRPTMMAAKKKGVVGQQFIVSDDTALNTKGIVSFERRSGVLLYTDPTFLFGEKFDLESDKNRRTELARFITTNQYFSKAFVNRTWEHFFGKSFTKDGADDFGAHNEPSEFNKEILEKLAKDWAFYKHNPKELIRWICNSRAYGLASVANKTNDKVEDEVLFSRMLLKAMNPEQLFESIMVATNPKINQSKEARAELREAWLNKLIANFGNDEGIEITYTGTVVQALLLMNGQDINKAITEDKEGTVYKVLQGKKLYRPEIARAAHNTAATQLYLAALNRPPSAKELNKIFSGKVYEFQPKVQVKINLNDDKTAQTFFTNFYQDLFWAMLNSNEFILNH